MGGTVQTKGGRMLVHRRLPLAVVDNVLVTPVIYTVHADHLNRPVRMDRCSQGQRLGCRLDAMGCASVHHRHGLARRALPRPVVPARSRLALQLAPAHFDLRASGTTIRPWAATPSPTRSASSMGRVCMGTNFIPIPGARRVLILIGSPSPIDIKTFSSFGPSSPLSCPAQ
jgi:hypothetical protein